MRRALVVAAACAATAPCGAAASDVALLVTLEGAGVAARGDGRELDVDEEKKPGPYKGHSFTLDGSGTLTGGGGRYVFLVPSYGIRFGLGFGFFGADGIAVKHDALPAGFDVTTKSTMTLSFEVALGREFDAGPVIPYIDARVGLEDFIAELQLRSADYGFVGSTPYASVSFGFGPRVGLLVPLGERAFIDVSGTYQLVGPWRVGGWAGLGVMLGDRDEPTPPPAAARR